MTSDRQPPRRSLLTNPFFWGALAGLLAIPLVRPLLRRVPAPPPVIAQLPDYRLVNQFDRPYGSAELRGKVYVVNFFFTRCPSICPKLTKAMRKLQDRFAALKVDIKLVSISVDPENDHPADLLTYGRKYDVDFSRWTFLTAKDGRLIRQLIVNGFRTYLGKPEKNPKNEIDIVHSGNVAIVDRAGGLRGFYRTDDDGLSEIVHRSVHVMLDKQR